MEAQAKKVAPLVPDIYLVLAGEEAQIAGVKLSEALRDTHPQLSLQSNVAAGSFKAQIKRADKSGAEYALILGGNEVEEKSITIKPLRSGTEQVSIPQAQLNNFIKNNILARGD
jgi:histidyl-tRNA synthetase